MAGVKTADPAAQDLDGAFATAMGQTAKPKEPPPPPDTDPDAPHGRGPDGAALAPFGLTKEGRPRKTSAGRRAKEDQGRIATPAAAAAAVATGGGPAAPAAHDYTASLSEFGDAIWFCASALGKGGSAIPFVGRFIPERKVAAQAGAIRAYKPNLVRAVNIAAQHNARAARMAASIEQGEITWVVMCGFMVMPFVTMSAAIWKGDAALAEIDPSLTVDQLAQANDVRLDKYLSDISDQMELLAAAAEAEALAAIQAEAGGGPTEPAEWENAMAAAQEAGLL